MLRSLALACLVALASGFAVTPSVAAVRHQCSLPAVRMAAGKLRVNDQVTVISGDGKGKVGKLLVVDVKKGKVIVEGVNIKTKHVKPMKEGESGSLLKKEAPIHISNVKLSDEQPAPVAAEE